jgi:hypothetical protein
MNKKLSIRAYRALKLAHLPMSTASDMRLAGDAIMDKKVWSAGLVSAVECYRLAGLGVYQIYHLTNERLELSYIKKLCVEIDSRK